MKYLYTIILSLLSIASFSQNKINFRIEGTNIKTNDNLSKLKLPIEFEFTKDFENKSISILNASDEVIAMKNAKFGSGELSLLDDISYNIQIDTMGKVNPSMVDDIKIKGKTIKLKIGNSDPIVLSFETEEFNNDNVINANYQPGYIYYDAIKLSTETDVAIVKKILGAYGITSNNYLNNPYINDVFKSEFTEGEAHGSPFTLLNTIGNADVSYTAAGIARFLAERTKDELSEAFFNKMKIQLNAYPEIKTVFPKTVAYLNTIESYSYASAIQVLKESFEIDVHNLPENLYNIKDLTAQNCNMLTLDDTCNRKDSINYEKCQVRLNKLSDFFKSQDGLWIALGMYTVKQGIQSTNPSDLLKDIIQSTEFTELKDSSASREKFNEYNAASSIALCNIISQSLISNENQQIWVSAKQLSDLINTTDAFKIYLGLLVAAESTSERKVKFYNSKDSLVSFKGILIENFNTYNQFKSLIQNTFVAYNATNNALKKIITASEKSIDADPLSLYNYYETLVSSIKPVLHSPLFKNLIGKDIDIEYEKVEKFLNPAVDMAYHISARMYTVAIYDASILLNSLNEILDENKHPIFKPITKTFVKYGTLISTVANAQSSDEVKKAIEASVLPIGSYSIKQTSNWSLSINSYVGAFWNYNHTKEYLTSYGLIAPIGFNISKGWKENSWVKKWLLMGGIGLNVQLFDLGALVNYYLIKGDTVTLPNDFKIKLSNIFSPGFSLHYNIKKTPLSISWGGQYIPTVYKYEQIDEKNELIPTNTWRWQFSILVDIPLINLKVWDFKK